LKEKLVVDHETLRRWLLEAGSGRCGAQAAASAMAERKPCFGAMVQLDGSHHDWFEARPQSAC
jgi:hypothetical protein